MQFTFGDEREVYLLDESALPVTEKESMQEGKRSICPRMKYGHANLNSFCPHTNERVCVFAGGQVIKKHKYTTTTYGWMSVAKNLVK